MIKIVHNFVLFFVNYDVFISVHEDNIAVANRIRNFLRKFGARVFVFKTSIQGGEIWRKEVKENLRDCNLFIELISKKSLKSRACTLEVGGAYFSDKDHLPVLLEGIDIKKLVITDEIQCVNYKNKDFFPTLRNKMFKVYFKRFILWAIIIGYIIYSKLK